MSSDDDSKSTFQPDGDMPVLRVTFVGGGSDTYHTQTVKSERKFKIVKFFPSVELSPGEFETNVLVNISRAYVEADDSFEGVKTVDMLPILGSFPVLAISDSPRDSNAHLEIVWDESTREVVPRIKWELLESIDEELQARTGRLRFTNPVCGQLCKAKQLVLHMPSAPEAVTVGIVSLLQLQTKVSIANVEFI